MTNEQIIKLAKIGLFVVNKSVETEKHASLEKTAANKKLLIALAAALGLAGIPGTASPFAQGLHEIGLGPPASDSQAREEYGDLGPGRHHAPVVRGGSLGNVYTHILGSLAR